MKAYQIKIVVKKSKPPVWWRLIVPANITFSALAVIVSAVTDSPYDPGFTFEFYQKLDLYEASSSRPLEPKSWQYSSREASNTYISDYLDVERNVSFKSASRDFRIETEKQIDSIDLCYPILIKSTSENAENAFERLKSGFFLAEGEGEFLSFDEMIRQDSSGRIRILCPAVPRSADDNTALSAIGLFQSHSHEFNRLAVSCSTEKSVANQPLTYFLGMLSLPQLFDKADDFRIQYTRSARHDEMVRKISEFLLDKDNLYTIFLPLFDFEIEAFEKILEFPGYKPDDEDEGLIFANLCWSLCMFRMQNGAYFIPKDITELYRKLDTDKLDLDRRKAHWIMDICDEIIPPYYAVISIKAFCRLCYRNKEFRMNSDETMSLFNRLLPEFNSCVIVGDDVISRKLVEQGQVDDVRREQSGKPLYIMTAEEIHEILTIGYPKSEKSYRKMRSWLQNQLRDGDLADDLLVEIHKCLAYGWGIDDAVELLEDNGIKCTFKEMQYCVSILADMSNHTRTFYNRGYTPSEISGICPHSDEPPVLAPLSSAAADMLRQAGPDLKERGITVDTESAAVEVGDPKKRRKKNKIYPNDPCPCGSGKKYKKCCGR